MQPSQVGHRKSFMKSETYLPAVTRLASSVLQLGRPPLFLLNFRPFPDTPMNLWASIRLGLPPGQILTLHSFRHCDAALLVPVSDQGEKGNAFSEISGKLFSLRL